MTPRQRILAALAGEVPDRAPLAIYDFLLPEGPTKEQLKREGLTTVRWTGMVAAEGPADVTRESTTYTEKGVTYSRETTRTPVGEVTSIRRWGGGYGSSRIASFPIQRPEDYRVFEYIARHTRYRPAYESYAQTEAALGEQGIATAAAPRTPIQSIMLDIAGVERFGLDLHDDVPEFWSLHEAMGEKQREWWEIMAGSPARIIWLCENMSAQLVGHERFARFYLPHYQMVRELVGDRCLMVHMDGLLRAIKGPLARAPIDVVEGFTPPPNGDLSVREGRSLWPEKTLYLNYAPSVHLEPPERIRAHTLELLEQAAPGNHFIVGVTENIPDWAWERSLTTINQVLNENPF
jgi:hypothetical protein